jgi:hypothetical protein
MRSALDNRPELQAAAPVGRTCPIRANLDPAIRRRPRQPIRRHQGWFRLRPPRSLSREIRWAVNRVILGRQTLSQSGGPVEH